MTTKLSRMDLRYAGAALYYSTCGLKFKDTPDHLIAATTKVYAFLKESGRVDGELQQMAVALGLDKP